MPRAGISKTRLCPPLTPIQAADLARAFLLDALATVRQARLDPRVMCRSRSERDALQRLVGNAAIVSAQDGTGLGAALESAFRHGIEGGTQAVAVLGADSPTLPPQVLVEAFAALEDGADVSLGPSDDGGYYLLAARKLHQQLFRDMTWSTSSVAAQTLERCRASELKVHQLPTWYDVDDEKTLRRLSDDLVRIPLDIAPRSRSELTHLIGALSLQRSLPPVEEVVNAGASYRTQPAATPTEVSSGF